MQLQEQSTATTSAQIGKWVTERAYSEKFGLARATLTNWRYRDHLAGRSEAAPGYPQYRRFGRAVRYWLPAEVSA